MTVAVTACGSAPVTVKPAASATPSASGSAVSGSPTGSPAASSSPASVPAGYTRVGGAAQGISVAAPASWAVIDPTKESMDSAASKLDVPGLSATTLVQDLETMQKLHGIMVVDAKSAVDDPHQFARNLNAYCSASGVTDAGSAGLQLLRTSAAAGFEKIGATHITQKDLEIGGVPGVQTSYQLSSPNVGTIYTSQLEVLPKPNDVCFVTLTFDADESAGSILSTAAATAQFP
jgi:hypothetical protein